MNLVYQTSHCYNKNGADLCRKDFLIVKDDFIEDFFNIYKKFGHLGPMTVFHNKIIHENLQDLKGRLIWLENFNAGGNAARPHFFIYEINLQ